jgi:hypothetical protein
MRDPVQTLGEWETALREDVSRRLAEIEDRQAAGDDVTADLKTVALDRIAIMAMSAFTEQLDRLDQVSRPSYSFGRRLLIAWNVLTSKAWR